MRIALLSYTFPRGMGYIGNMLPRYLARLGADVHYVTMDLPHYFQNADRKDSYGEFEGLDTLKPGAIESYDGFKIHCLGHSNSLGQMKYTGLEEKLRSLQVDVVQSFLAIGWPALQAALLRRKLGFSLFTANHTTASVFPLAQHDTSFFAPARIKNLVTRFLPGRYISMESTKCYAATIDCQQVAVNFFGVQPRKIVLAPLGVDTDLFWPVRSDSDRAARARLRSELGVQDDEVLFIYTGQFTDAKNPAALADAVEIMVDSGKRVRALFIGAGPQTGSLSVRKSSIVKSFMPNADLPAFYRAADVGVWPTQESTSMLDAAACGLPIVVNDTLRAVERIEGNGLQYRLNDIADLVRVLTRLTDASERHRLGAVGSQRMEQLFSWRQLVARRFRDYEASMESRI